MAEISDYYQTLGVDASAGEAELKAAYRQLVRQFHPDRNGDSWAVDRFKAVQEAYEVLSDPHRRQEYDRLRRRPVLNAHLRGGAGRAGTSYHEDLSGAFSASSGFGSVFSHLFEDRESGASARHRGDIEVEATFSFEQSLEGGTTQVALSDGRTVSLTIPKGVRPGLKIRVRGKGHTNPATGKTGDLYVTFRVVPSSRFRREGDDLHVVETVTAMEAMLGSTRSIVNAYGSSIRVQVPPGTQPGERLRLRGQGVETRKGQGDLYVEIRVSIPRSLTDEQREELGSCAKRIGLQ